MPDHEQAPKSAIIPGLRYQNASAAIEWLCEAFGFEKMLVVPGSEEGQIAHAQLIFGTGMVMVGSADSHGGNEFDRLVRPPADLGGLCSQGAYVIVEDVDTHHDRARAAGAEILMAPKDEEYGGRTYLCQDLEGHVWCFGSYDPWVTP